MRAASAWCCSTACEPLNIKVNIVGQPWPTMVARGSKPDTSPDMISVYVTPISTDPDAVAYQYHREFLGPVLRHVALRERRGLRR